MYPTGRPASLGIGSWALLLMQSRIMHMCLVLGARACSVALVGTFLARAAEHDLAQSSCCVLDSDSSR